MNGDRFESNHDFARELTAKLLDDPRLVVTVGEAALMLGVSRSFAYELVRRGDLHVIQLGRRRVVPKVALVTLVGLTTSNSKVANKEST